MSNKKILIVEDDHDVGLVSRMGQVSLLVGARDS